MNGIGPVVHGPVPIINGAGIRLPYSNMTAAQLFDLAGQWWNRKGRDLIRHNQNRKNDGVKDDAEMLQVSGILGAKMFSDLTQKEQVKVACQYYIEWCKENGVPPVEVDAVEFLLQWK